MKIDRVVPAALCALLLASTAGACVSPGATPTAPASGAPTASDTPTAPTTATASGSATALISSASPVASSSPSYIGEAAAVKAVEAFVGRSIAGTATGPETGGIATTYEVQGADVSARVDAQTGRVVMLMLPGKMPGKARTLTDEQAAAAAEKFLTAHAVSVAGMRRTVEWQDRGDFGEYRVTWQLYQGEIEMPEQTEVDLDGAKGEVFNFIDFRAVHGPAPAPKLTRGQAEAAAIAASSISNPGVESAKLVYTRPMTAAGLDSTAPLVLVWAVEVDDTKSDLAIGCVVWVDALSGKAEVVARH